MLNFSDMWTRVTSCRAPTHPTSPHCTQYQAPCLPKPCCPECQTISPDPTCTVLSLTLISLLLLLLLQPVLLCCDFSLYRFPSILCLAIVTKLVGSAWRLHSLRLKTIMCDIAAGKRTTYNQAFDPMIASSEI